MRAYSTLGGINHGANGAVRVAFTCDAVIGRHRIGCTCDAVPSIDPTKTHADRVRGQRYLDGQIAALKKLIRAAIIDQDALGTGSAKLTATGWTFAIMGGAFDQSSVLGTMFAQMVRTALLESTPKIIAAIVADGYRAGTRHGKSYFSDAVVDPLTVRNSMRIAANAVQQEIQGIADALVQQMARAGRVEVATKAGPLSLYHSLARICDTVGTNRLRAMVNQTVVHAHALATLDVFEAAGVTQVGSIPETVPPRIIEDAPRKKKKKVQSRARPNRGGPGSRGGTSRSTQYRIRKAQERLERLKRVDVLTAGDDDVCPVCERIAEDGPYSINHARQLIPAHPNCRCVFVPHGDARFARDYDPNQPRDPKGTPTGGQWTKAEGSEARTSITEEEKEGVRRYVSSSLAASATNNALRKGLDPEENEDTKGIVAALDAAIDVYGTPQTAPLYRGIAGYDPEELGISKGQEFTDLGFGSTSRDQKIARKFALGGETRFEDESQVGILFKIKPNGVKGMPMDSWGSYEEKETLLKRKTRYRVTGVTAGVPGKKLAVVSLEAIP